MKLPYSEPHPAGSERTGLAKKYRDLATEIARLQSQALTRANGEEADHGPRKNAKGEEVGARYPANFTKGLLHDTCGLLEHPEDYACLVEAINSPDETLFEKHVQTAVTRTPEGVKTFACTVKDKAETNWRGWESPRAGHVYELEGPDSGAVGMAPAPRVGSSELAAEMAEVYALAILRDVPFTTIVDGGQAMINGKGDAKRSAEDIAKLLNGMPFYAGKAAAGNKLVSSTPSQVDADGLNSFERNRRKARTGKLAGGLVASNLFRGSTKGALNGPYLSQFMLVGAGSLNGKDNDASGYPDRASKFGLQDGFIPYGSLIADQRTMSHLSCLDYMTDWCSWLDVQNGANFKGADQFEDKRRFITTPRDLATYVHFDALYEAYLNACLILLAMNAPISRGFPEPSPSGHRDAFATFGGPHILSLVTEVATRCLKAVRRQKFNYHRRARPEALGGRLTLLELGGKVKGLNCKLGCAETAFERTRGEIPLDLRKAIKGHNKAQNLMDRPMDCGTGSCLPEGVDSDLFENCSLLLAMAFPEGSPMHPAYGAGHATVAGGCVTMLKAFFDMFEDCDSGKEREFRVNAEGKISADGTPVAYVPTDDGTALKKAPKPKTPLTIQGELDKLAANIAIGRNMAGVHYYSDYYDSLRMGERVAVGILMEQAPAYGDGVEWAFNSFDGDLISITGDGGSCPSLSILDSDGTPVSTRDWWLRHVSGQELIEDL